MLRVAPQHAWRYSRGAGVMVAILDSGVDATVPELAGRVTVGDDIITGTGRGNTDCLGSGTAMAGIVAASSSAGSGVVGMAPAATVMPVRVAPTKAAVSAANQASAIEVAASAGAKVIALGGHIDVAQPAVASAIELAAARGAVVVAAAPSASHTPAASGAATSAGVIWVGAININGAAVAKYQPGAVDVVAPGVDVTSLGITGTGQFQGSGAQYAVAFVAGEAALVRARYPKLTAAQVVRRIEATADRTGPAVPDATFGWGLIDPGVAVTRVIPDESRGPAPAIALPARNHGWSSLRTRALMITILLALVLVVLLALRIRRMVRPARPGRADATAAPRFLSTANSTGGQARGDRFAATASATASGLPGGAYSAAARRSPGPDIPVPADSGQIGM
jgi:membrane-anchored mycosin MYCP